MTGNTFVDSFLNYKLAKVDQMGIRVETALFVADQLFIPPKDLSIILGNLLDNALTAASECTDDPYIFIEMRQNPGNLYLELRNAYSRPIKRQGERFLSTKEKNGHHGYGLENVKHVIRQYKGSMDFSTEDQVFTVKVLLFEK